MLEIIALIFLCKRIGTIAERKGLKPGLWKFYTVLAWLGCEFTGVILGMMLFGFNKDDLFGLLAFALVCAFGGYLIVKMILEKKPDIIDYDDIDKIGNNQ